MTPWLPALPGQAGRPRGWVARPRDYVHFQQAPHTCGSAQPADPRGGPVGRVGETIHNSAESPWIPWVLLPTNILKVASSFSSSSTTQTQAQQILQAGMGLALGRAGSALQAAADGIIPFPACLGSAEGCGPLM